MLTCTFENDLPAGRQGKTTSLRHVVVHAIVEKDGALLLVKRSPELLGGDEWSLPGGFLDRNENARQAVLRELKEETGWEGVDPKLFRVNTNPNRPKEDRQNVALDFLIKPIKQIGEPDHESSKVEWIPIEKLLPFDQFAFDHGESIELYLKYRKTPFPLPILD